MSQVKGIIPSIATPFAENGSVDYDSFQNLVKTLIHGGCHGVSIFGIAGEYYKLSQEECDKLAKITVDESRKLNGISIISVTQHSTEEAVRRAKYYEETGADMLNIIPPFFLKPGAEALYQHIKAIGQAVKIPVMVQYAPELTGITISPADFSHLSIEVPNISCYKIECKFIGAYISSLLKETENKVNVFIGNGGLQFIEGFDRGAVGVIPCAGMFDIYLMVYKEYISGNREKAQMIHNQYILPMLNHILQDIEMVIAYEKRILKKRGIITSDYCRSPTFNGDIFYDRLFEEQYEKIAAVFRQ